MIIYRHGVTSLCLDSPVVEATRGLMIQSNYSTVMVELLDAVRLEGVLEVYERVAMETV